MKKVFFIGVHNKPGLPPLCSSTRSGKVIDQIISRVNLAKCYKTNFIDADSLPGKLTNVERNTLGLDWIMRTEYNAGDTVVLLGKWVQQYFPHWLLLGSEIIEINHPAYPKSRESIEAYIQHAADQINITNASPGD